MTNTTATMLPTTSAGQLPGTTDQRVTRRGNALRLVIASVAMLACATFAAVPYLIPGVEARARTAEADGRLTELLLFDTLRFPLAMLLALGLLLIAARVEKVRLRDYFGYVRAPQARGALLTTTIAAATVTALAAGLAHLTGWDAGRGGVGDTAGIPLVLMLLYGVSRAFLLQGIQEEWWFRGFAFRGHRQRPWFVLITTTVVFTALHLSSSGGQETATERVLYLVLPLGMGLWAGVERWCTGTVWGAVGVHGGIHTGLIVPALLGWGLGPTTWLVVGVALCVAAVARMLVRRPWADHRL